MGPAYASGGSPGQGMVDSTGWPPIGAPSLGTAATPSTAATTTAANPIRAAPAFPIRTSCRELTGGAPAPQARLAGVTTTAAAPISTSGLRGAPVAAISIAIALWTANLFFVRHAEDILEFTAWRMVFALPVLAVTAAGSRWRSAPDADRVPVPMSARVFVVCTGVLFGVSAWINFEALNQTTLVNVGVIHALQPAVVVLVAGRYLGELADWPFIAKLGVAVAGAVLVAAASTGEGVWSLRGDLLAVVGLFMNTAWFMAGRWVRTRTSLDATTYMVMVFTSAAAAMVVIAAVSGHGLSGDASTIGYAIATAVLGTAGHTLMAWAHRFVPAAISSLFLLTQPALIAVLAWVAFDEALHPLHYVGGALVLGALATIVARGGPVADVAP